jgi:hypothetical protein
MVEDFRVVDGKYILRVYTLFLKLTGTPVACQFLTARTR